MFISDYSDQIYLSESDLRSPKRCSSAGSTALTIYQTSAVKVESVNG